MAIHENDPVFRANQIGMPDSAVTLAEGWTLDPQGKKQNRLGQDYAKLIPQWERNADGSAKVMKIPSWYNR